MAGASAMLKRMKAVPGMAPNVVVYTTMLKGHMLAGDVEAAEALLQEMPRQKPPVPLDARAVNTFLRTCQRAGDTPRAWAAYQRMMIDSPSNPGHPSITPDDATYKLVARLLAQGLRLADLQGVIARAEADNARAKAEGPGGGDVTAPPCQFWLGGCCDRGAGCQFFHDPTVTQRAVGGCTG
jgi:pentatricopeptide repeat protein